jgi:hypothetical protein
VRVEHLSVVEAEWFLIEHLIEEKGRDSGTVQNYRGREEAGVADWLRRETATTREVSMDENLRLEIERRRPRSTGT